MPQAKKSLPERVAESAVARKRMIERFGRVPLSVLRLSRGALSRSMISLQHENPDRHTKRMKETHTGRERKRFGLLGGCGPGYETKNRQAASLMPAELVDFFCRYYAAPGQLYLDPFAGQGIQLQVAKRLGMGYVGFDVCREFCEFVRAIISKIDDGTTTLVLHEHDARDPAAVPDDSGDFCFTSPPYWDIEWYGDEPEQIGTGHSYESFLEAMEQIARAWLPKFKVGAPVVVNVNDFRRDGRFYAYHAHTIELFERAGWTCDDTWIVDGLVGGLPRAWAVSLNEKRRAPKVHEFAIVFKRTG